MTSIRTTPITSRRGARLLVLVAMASAFGVAAPQAVGASAGAASPAPADYVTDGVVARDDFSASSSSGPVAAQIGGPWVVSASSGAVLSTGGGSVSVGALPAGRSVSLGVPGASVRDVQVRHALTLPAVTSVATGLYESTDMRTQTGGDRYSATVVVRENGQVALRADRTRAGATTVLARATPSVTIQPGGRFYVESRVVGSVSPTLLARVWREGQHRPAWQVDVKDSGAQAITSAGAVGLSAYASAGGRPQTMQLSDFTAWSLRSPQAASTASKPSATAAPAAPGAALTGAAPAPSATPKATAVVTPKPAAAATPKPVAAATQKPVPAVPVNAGVAAAPVVAAATSSAGFAHPGIVDSAAQLAFVKQKIAAKQEPWTSAFNRAKSSRYASLSWQPRPVASVGCGAYNTPNQGCTAETDDAQAAYTDALIWAYTGDRAYAQKSIQILNAWSGVLKEHKFDTAVYKNGKLQAAWAAEIFPKAAEIIRYTGAGWAAGDVQRFESMLRTAFLPAVRDGWIGGGANWQMSMAEATMNIGVFTNDRAVFNDGLGDWRAQVKSAIYLRSDGAAPVVPAGTSVKASGIKAYWYNPKSYVDGLEGETCRDADHMAMGLAATLNAAETGSIQGVDLYREQQQRLVAGMEYNAKYLNDPKAAGWACSTPLKVSGTASRQIWEIGYHHYADVLGVSLPQTRKYVLAHRPTGTELFMDWQTLTHAGS